MSEPTRILVTGVPHSGTSILRKLIGNHPDVWDVSTECICIRSRPKGFTNEKAFVCKVTTVYKTWPEGYLIVGVYRDIHDILLGMEERGLDTTYEEFRREYIKQNTRLLEHAATKDNVIVVRYESLFDSEHTVLKRVFGFCGLSFFPEIVTENHLRKALINRGEIQDEEPPRTSHEDFRTWQINSPFKQCGGRWKTEMSQELKDKIRDDKEMLDFLAKLGYEQA